MRKWPLSIPYVIGLVFLYAGTQKLFDPSHFIKSFQILKVSDQLAFDLATFVTAVELYAAAMLLCFERKNTGCFVAMLSLICFTVFLLYLSTLAHPPECGCGPLLEFFKSSRQNALAGIVRNLALIGLLWYYHRGVLRAELRQASWRVPGGQAREAESRMSGGL
jgi:uncharacterized membrane protein YphA (DoxX/SURF4 family)